MVDLFPTKPLFALADRCDAVVLPAWRRAAIACVLLLALLGLLAARQGTWVARVSAVTITLAAIMGVVAVWVRSHWIRRNELRLLDHLARRIDPGRHGAARRAVELHSASKKSLRGASGELVDLHLARALAALPSERIAARAERERAWLSMLALVFAGAAFVTSITGPWKVVEGADVLIARRGVAPVTMRWFDNAEVTVRPPEYLHHRERHLDRLQTTVSFPRGSLLSVRGTAVRTGRPLALSDGKTEVPLLDDGMGGLVARWQLGESVTLRVIARFGSVVIEDPNRLTVHSIVDRAPTVILKGAPRTIHLLDDPGGGDVSVRYEASDDHGLREVDLVLRSGGREERRILSQLDGETPSDRGGMILRGRDPFLRRSYAPVEVTVEARDNDLIAGPKWGKSEVLTLIPPFVGEPEARRQDLLRELRDVAVDLLASQMRQAGSLDTAEKKTQFAADQGARWDELKDRLSGVLGGSLAGVRVPGRPQAIVRGQVRKVDEAFSRLSRAPSSTTALGLIDSTERLTLVIDGVLRGLAQKDARDAALELAGIAEDLAHHVSLIGRPEEKARAEAGADASLVVLRGGATSLKRLGSLGRDLGEIIEAYDLRVARARKQDDPVHAELAARDLATRLREPDPSFNTRGRGGVGMGGSGGGTGEPLAESAEAEGEGDRAFRETAQEVERLAQEHAGGIDRVERALAGAQTPEEQKALADDGKSHARAVRDATNPLPSVGSGSDSWTSKGAAAREHAESMARAFEQGALPDAIARGQNALNALDEAKRIASRERWRSFTDSDRRDADRVMNDARAGVENELKWAEKRLTLERKQASSRAERQLSASGSDEEAWSGRARALGDKGEGQGALPAPAIDALRGAERFAGQAAQSLRRGEADRALGEQRDAQRMLERASEALNQSGEGEGGSGDSGNAMSPRQHADIPGVDAHKGPDQFRLRVMKGLGQSSGSRLQDAVRRYAEGLLR